MPAEPTAAIRPVTPGVFSPKQARSSRTQAAILDAARAMVSRGGVESLTISGVAAQVGLTTGAFYARFRNKDALLRALLEETLVLNREAIDDFRAEVAASRAGLAEIITTFVPPAMKLIRDNSALFRFFGSHHSGAQSERDRAIRILEAAIAPVHELLREHAEEIPELDPQVCAAMLIVMIQGMADWAFLLRQSKHPVVPVCDDALAAEIIRASLGYLGLSSTTHAQNASEVST